MGYMWMTNSYSTQVANKHIFSSHLGWLSPNTKPFINLLNLVLGRVDSSVTVEFSPAAVFDM